MTLKMVVERILKESVPERKRIRNRKNERRNLWIQESINFYI